MHYLYIIYSPLLDKYYVGETNDIQRRIPEHKTRTFKGSYTSQTTDWELKLSLLFENINQARKAEAFIKRMNSKKFIEKLILDSDWFLEKFNR